MGTQASSKKYETVRFTALQKPATVILAQVAGGCFQITDPGRMRGGRHVIDSQGSNTALPHNVFPRLTSSCEDVNNNIISIWPFTFTLAFCLVYALLYV